MAQGRFFLEEWRGDRVKADVERGTRDSVRETLEAAAERARELAPVRTGALRDSIGVDVDLDGTEGSFYVGAPYGFFVEIGARGQAPRPFMRPAADQEFPNMTERLRDKL